MAHPTEEPGGTPPSPQATPARRRREIRHWLIPPAILREPDETLEGSHILDEITGDTGHQLWMALRQVTLWASVPRARRGGLFREGAAGRRLERLAEARVEFGVQVPLATLASVLDDPAGVRPDVVTLACLRIAGWAEARWAQGTAVLFAQAGALASPDDAAAAYTVGRLAHAWGRMDRAETWLRRAAAVARRTRAREWYARAYVDLGMLLLARGEHVQAGRCFTKGARAARRFSVPAQRARALHGLARVALRAGATADAERLARTALRGYRADDPEREVLRRELAGVWLERGEAQRALAALKKLVPGAGDAAERAAVRALLARAAAECGNERLYEQGWSTAWAIVSRQSPARHRGALLDLARAAATRGQKPRVGQVADRLAGVADPAERSLLDDLSAGMESARRGGVEG